MKILTAFLFAGVLGRLFAGADPGAIAFVDAHLESWDRFARGENDLAPLIRESRDEFHERLVSLLRSDRKQGVPRLVFYGVLQVGSFFPLETDLGKEVSRISSSLPVFVDEKKNGKKSIFGGYVYLWWREHKTDYASYGPLEDWEKRELSQNFIKMYESVREKEKKG